MDFLYPAGYDPLTLSKTAKALKIARNSRCLACSSCPGLRPPSGVDVTLDSSEPDPSLSDLFQSDEDKDVQLLSMCVCGHGVASHDADVERLGADEFARRARVAVRMDELRAVRRPSIRFVMVTQHVFHFISSYLIHWYATKQVRGFRGFSPC
jgi:histone acetyltransferase